MGALESLCPPKVCKKGETMTDFFETQKYARRTRARISDCIANFGQSVTKVSGGGVEFTEDSYILGCYCVRRFNIARRQRERFIAALPSGTFQLRD
eukprot:1006188-Pyramimonas_sp.AAC.1